MYNCQGEPLSIHVFMNILLNFEGVVYQAKCIQWEKKKYELLINADREKLKIEEVLAAYRKISGRGSPDSGDICGRNSGAVIWKIYGM